MHDGKPVAGAEVCLFRAGPTASPITRFLASSAVKCAAASGDVEIGEGRWNAFARKGTELVEAATVDVTAWKLAEQESIFVWIPRIDRYPDIEMPLVPELGSFPQQDLGDRDVLTFGVPR